MLNAGLLSWIHILRHFRKISDCMWATLHALEQKVKQRKPSVSSSCLGRKMVRRLGKCVAHGTMTAPDPRRLLSFCQLWPQLLAHDAQPPEQLWHISTQENKHCWGGLCNWRPNTSFLAWTQCSCLSALGIPQYKCKQKTFSSDKLRA